MQMPLLFKLFNTFLPVYPFSLALPIKSALFASALVLALSGHGLLLAQSRTLQHYGAHGCAELEDQSDLYARGTAEKS